MSASSTVKQCTVGFAPLPYPATPLAAGKNERKRSRKQIARQNPLATQTKSIFNRATHHPGTHSACTVTTGTLNASASLSSSLLSQCKIGSCPSRKSKTAAFFVAQACFARLCSTFACIVSHCSFIRICAVKGHLCPKGSDPPLLTRGCLIGVVFPRTFHNFF